jgi:hypothetical protein
VKRLPRIFGLFALVLALVTAACGDTIRPSAAKVNGSTITQDSLDAELEAIQGNAGYVSAIEQGGMSVKGEGDGTVANAFVGRVLTRQIFLVLVHDEVERRKLEITAADRKQATPSVVESVGGDKVFKAFPKSYRDTLVLRNAEVTKLQDDLGGAEVDDAAVKAYYDANGEQFAQTCVSHILFAVAGADGQIDQGATAAQIDRLKSEATAAKAELDGGADFAALAKERSADGSKDSGGDLECGPAGRFVPAFETAMDALAVGAVSDPVVTQFGVHLIKVTDRKAQTLEEATPQIRQQLQGEGQQAFSQFLQEALAKAKVTVNPRYGKFSKDGQSPGIIPPGAPTTTVPGPKGGVTEDTVPSPLQP